MRRKRGFTVLEMIITVAILAVTTGMITLSINNIFSSSARKCAQETDALLSQTRIDAMSRTGGATLHLYRVDNTVRADCTVGTETVRTETVGDARCTVTYTVAGVPQTLDAGGFVITFKRDTGAFDFTKNSWGADTDTGRKTCSAITVTAGGRTYTITLYPATGAHVLGGAA